jgi:predicted metal-dependent hydrolase
MIRLFRREPPPSRDWVTLNLAGETLRIALKRVRGARRYTLRVRAATRDVVLSMPVRGSYESARAFAERHAAWINAKLSRLPSAVPFEPGQTVPLRGVDHVVVHSQKRGSVWVEAASTLAEKPRLCVGGDPAFASRRIADFFKREARRDLDAATKRYADALGKKARRLAVRDTTSRWGSCSAQGSLSFSWRLVLAPPFVLDYLAAHEIAHLVHMNHSPAFWKLTRRLYPDTDRAESWLNAHGASLHRYGDRPERQKVR